MKVRATTNWVTRDGVRRRIRLYEAWCNLQGRCRGGKSKDAGKYWNVGYEFGGWQHFREWAISAGYRKGVQLDRLDSGLPYRPDNLQWLTASEHSKKSAALARTRGFTGRKKAEPLPDPEVPF